MESGFIVLIAVALLLGVVIGMSIARVLKKPAETKGVIYVYYSEHEDKPSLLLEYGASIDDIASQKQVMFDVDVIRQNSHK